MKKYLNLISDFKNSQLHALLTASLFQVEKQEFSILQHFEEYTLKDQNSAISTIFMISFKNWIKIKVHIVYRQLCSGNMYYEN